ncbi:MAG: 50S ribosomal protein L13 [Thermoplasmata archaeon]|nr:50S ribosomal protein L13 [Thermoplasmata archaeon]
MRVIDADGLVLGRMCSTVAKNLLEGEEITIVNADKVLISGNRKSIMEEYERSRGQGKVHKGPFYPRMPDSILKRTVSRMMQHRKAHGKAAMSRLTVHIGVPPEFKDAKFEKIETAMKADLKKYMTLGDVSRELGAKF